MAPSTARVTSLESARRNERSPLHAIPTAFVHLESLPGTALDGLSRGGDHCMVNVSLLPSAPALGRGSGNRSVPALRCAFPVLSIFARIIPLFSLKNSSVVSRREFARETLQIIVLFRTDPAGIGQNRMNSLPNSLKAGNRTIQRRRRAPRGESGRCAVNRGCAFLGATRVLLTWIRCPAREPRRRGRRTRRRLCARNPLRMSLARGVNVLTASSPGTRMDFSRLNLGTAIVIS